MKQPKFNLGDSFLTTHMPEGFNLKYTIDGVNYTQEVYTVSSIGNEDYEEGYDAATLYWDNLESGIESGEFILITTNETKQEEEPLTLEYIENYQAQEFHCYNPELDFTRDEGNHYTIDGLDEEELLEVDAWVNTPKDAVNSFLDKMMKE